MLYNKEHHTQRFFDGHDDEIISLAIDPLGRFVVTGQQGKRPIPRVWSAATGAELCALTSHGRSVHQGAAVALDFSPDRYVIHLHISVYIQFMFSVKVSLY